MPVCNIGIEAIYGYSSEFVYKLANSVHQWVDRCMYNG